MSETGRYVRQPTGYRAFVPEPLPERLPFALDLELATRLSRADRALARLDGAATTLPNPQLFVAMYVRREAQLSSEIEGTQATLADVVAREQGMRDGTSTDTGEVLNYVASLEYGLRRLDQLPVSTRLIKEIHARLMQGVRGQERTPGEIRRTQNWIGPAGCQLAEASFVPPPPDQVLSHLSELEGFVHRSRDWPPLIVVALVHAQFETIHPFLDGNGRLGRLLITFLLVESEVLSQPLLYLSHYFKRHKKAYYDHLQRVRDEGDWRSWLDFFLTGVEEVALDAVDRAQRILALRESHRALVMARLPESKSAIAILERLYEAPVFSASSLSKALGFTPATAYNIIPELERLGIVREVTGRAKGRRWHYDAFLDLLTD